LDSTIETGLPREFDYFEAAGIKTNARYRDTGFTFSEPVRKVALRPLRRAFTVPYKSYNRKNAFLPRGEN
jgi:hypothetical protein